MAGFGTELRRRRQALGMSLVELAQLVHYDKGYLSKIENGVKPPNIKIARACDAALDADGALVECVAGSRRADEPCRHPLAGAVETWSLQRQPGRSLLSASIRDERSDDVPALVMDLRVQAMATNTELAPYRALLALYRQMGQTHSASELIPVLWAQTQMLLDRARRASDAQRLASYDLATHFCHYISWLAHETGDMRSASWWIGQAEELALRADNADMRAYSLVRRALVTLYQDDGRATVDLARSAQTDTVVSPRVRGLAAQREAQGHALNGEYDACHRALDCAADHFASAGAAVGDEPVIGSSTVQDLATATTGWCLFDLGRPLEAAEVLGRALDQIDPGAVRSRARYAARRALAYAMAKELDQACESAGELLGSAQGLESATVRADLRDLRRSLNRWPDHPPVRDLLPRIAAALHVKDIV